VTRVGRGGTVRMGALLLGGLALVVSCARPSRPSGGPRDWIPPMVVSTWPDTFEVIEPTRKPVVIRFNERLSERPTQGALDNAVIISPATRGQRVKLTRAGLEISIDGGFRPGLVYRVRVLPTIRDLFGNAMEGPFELVFSTGGELETNVIAGLATDRITGEPLANVRVEARDTEGTEDAPAYLALTDTAGVYVLRYVPSGSYRVTLFEDVNRNAEPDFRELQAETGVAVGLQPPQADTVIQEVALLRPDTTPAQLIRLQAEDSLLLRLTFDDYLDPEVEGALDRVEVRLSREEEGGPLVARLLWEHQVDSMRAHADSVKAEADRLAEFDSLRSELPSLRRLYDSLQAAGQSTRADSVEVQIERITERLAPPEPARRPGPELEEAATAREPEPIRPQQFFFALLEEPLAPGEAYQVRVTEVTNINALGGGGGEAAVSWTPPDPPAGARPPPSDTTGAVPDTVGAPPPDTTVVPPPDTTRAVPHATVLFLPGSTGESLSPAGRSALPWWMPPRAP
jgi:hypothetical protein